MIRCFQGWEPGWEMDMDGQTERMHHMMVRAKPARNPGERSARGRFPPENGGARRGLRRLWNRWLIVLPSHLPAAVVPEVKRDGGMKSTSAGSGVFF